MTSYPAGSACPPTSTGQLMPKKPPSYRAWCHAACPAQYSSDVDDAGGGGVLSLSPPRSRSRNAASGGESPKSMSRSDPVPVEHPRQVRPHAPEEVAGDQRAAQVHVGQAVPGVPDAAVHLDGGLAHGPPGPGAVRLRGGRRG